jgi:hypothetical protein
MGSGPPPPITVRGVDAGLGWVSLAMMDLGEDAHDVVGGGGCCRERGGGAMTDGHEAAHTARLTTRQRRRVSAG